jgi:hypothetical protein
MRLITAVAVGTLGIAFGGMLLSGGRIEVTGVARARDASVVRPDPGAPYIRAIEEFYIPAKHEAEKSGDWFRPYDVARRIHTSCEHRADWDPSVLQAAMPVPEALPGFPIDWRTKAVTAARELTGCIQAIRSEERK